MLRGMMDGCLLGPWLGGGRGFVGILCSPRTVTLTYKYKNIRLELVEDLGLGRMKGVELTTLNPLIPNSLLALQIT